MKQAKIGLIVEASILSLQIPVFWLGILFARLLNSDVLFQVTFVLLILTEAAAFLAALVMAVLTAASLFRSPDSPYRFTFILKLCLIPWFFTNLVFWLLMAGVFANPFLMLAIPIVLWLGTSLTYILFLSFSIPNLVYTIRGMIQKDIPVNAFTVWSLILHFIFVADLVGASMLFFRERAKPSNKNRQA